VPYYTPDGIAVALIHEGQRRGITQKGIQIALSTGLVESNLTVYANQAVPDSLNYPYDAMGSDSYSVGVMQQQVVGPPWWWGDAPTCMDPASSAGLFYNSLVNQRIGTQDYNTDATTPGGWAQMVQNSAYPDRYDERYSDACGYYDRLHASPCPGAPGGPPDQPGTCPTNGGGGGDVPLKGEVVLSYDSSIVPQDTYYDCGPASCQVVLNGKGIIVDEGTLCQQIGTTENGTDDISWIQPVINSYLPDAQFATTYMPDDPPSQSQKDALWAAITNCIDAGYGFVMNWVAPPSNYPIGIKGSTSPSYGGGTVFHYLSCMGYDDNPQQRALWITDSGFSPFEYWCAFDQVATLIPPKGYLVATVAAPAPGPTPPTVPDYSTLGYEQLCGPLGSDGYGTGWPQLGTNDAGQNLYMVDALGIVKQMVEGATAADAASYVDAHRLLLPKTTGGTPDYTTLSYEQLAGPRQADGYGYGWPQLGGLTVSDAMASIKDTLSGVTPPTPVPPNGGGGQPTDRHALLTCSGTWAAPGVGYPSDVAQACSAIVEEIPVQAPWSFGPIPPGSFTAPSYQESVQIGLDWAVNWLLANPNRTFLLGGYSQGGECASRIYMETLPGGRLESVAHNFCGGFTFGNPCREAGHSFYAGPDRPWRGIASVNQTNMGDWWADECEQCDMYADVPLDLRGEIMTDVYTLCIEIQMHDMQQFMTDFVANCLAVLGDLDGNAYNQVLRQFPQAASIMKGANILPKEKTQPLRDKIITVKGIAAAIGAAILGIQFMATNPPTACHIQYEFRTWNGTQTYRDHAIQHVNDWASRRAPTK
jgi:hypothetical protein